MSDSEFKSLLMEMINDPNEEKHEWTKKINLEPGGGGANVKHNARKIKWKGK